MKRHPILTVIGLGVLVLAAVAFLVVRSFLSGGGDTSEIPIDEVIRRYQASTSPPTSTLASMAVSQSTTTATATTEDDPVSSADDAISVLPAPGVYLYTTTGGDSIDVLQGAHHGYPAITTITVTPSDCGVLQRWDVVAERWQAWQRCATEHGVAEPHRENYDEFFDIGQTDTYECTGDDRPLDATAGTTWVRTCRKGDHEDVHTGTVIGIEQVSVGTTSVAALHVRTEVDNGRESDRQTTDNWYALGSDLLLVQSASNHTTNDTDFGVVHYDEEYEIRLTSLDPIS